MDVPLAAPFLAEDTLGEAERVLREEFFLGGETVGEFEADMKSYLNDKWIEHVVDVVSGYFA